MISPSSFGAKLESTSLAGLCHLALEASVPISSLCDFMPSASSSEAWLSMISVSTPKFGTG